MRRETSLSVSSLRSKPLTRARGLSLPANINSMTSWECLRGLGKQPYKARTRPAKTGRKKRYSRALSRAERESLFVERISNRIKRGVWVPREDFFLAHDRYLRSNKWLAFRKAILLRAGGFCEYCFKRSKILQVHHLTYERWGFELEEDVLALCLICHEEIHE